ncbi:LacI family DNA-binding transcriptional regulator [Paenibacillus mendelii]|uniref:LacI family DNA-binding transcriptional regulator n=1 Tax=Paenibacillus mendelii TaxID=206163 RepID=A0ABV6J9N3_9BACL|nr:LacI family DNA-binding transcriptional regulator [Paenibacillus mendelii]MCQ6563802.1 LacI family transcriptional regulator [Paenibacillus mendelii]
MPRKKVVTLQVIADQLGVTVHTVSKALRGLPGMSESTRREICQTARQLGYLTKAQTAGLSAEQIPWVGAGKPRRFAMLMAADQSFYHMQVQGLQQRMNELGHVLSAMVLPNHFTSEKEVMEWLERSGVLYMDGLFTPPALPYWIEAILLRLPLPKVMINYPPDSAEADSVIWDVQHAVHQSVNALYDYGHRRILFIGDIHDQRGFRLRWEAFQAACARLKLPIDPAAHMTEVTVPQAERLERLRSKLLSGDYTAVLCRNNEDVNLLLEVLHLLGLSVPDSISLITTDHDSHPLYPGISRPILLIREAAERAAELMLRRIANPRLPFEHVRLAGTFFWGETVKSASSGLNRAQR